MPIYDAAGRDRIVPDPVNTQISISFEQQSSYIAPILFPTVSTGGVQSGRYEVFGRDAFRRNFSGDVRAPGARANEVEGRKRYIEDTYFAVEHALEELIPDEEIENNRDENPEADSVENLTNDLLLGKELAARDLLYDDSNYLGAHVETLTAGEHFDEFSTSDPITLFRDLFRTFHSTLGTVPNLAVIPWTAMSYLEDHPLIVARYAPVGGVITPEQIAEILGVQRIVVPGGNYNDANPGQAAALSEIWGNNIVLGLVPSRPSRRTPALGYEFLWRIPGARGGQDNLSVDRRRDSDRIGWINRVRRRYDLKLVGRDPDLVGHPVVAGMLVKNVVSE
jgi:hypothetical protein